MKYSAAASRAVRVAFAPLALTLSLAACGAGERSTADGSAPASHPTASTALESADTNAANEREAGASALAAVIDSLHQPSAGLYTAGQPEPGAWQVAASAGITTVINLRPAAEMDGRDEAAEVAEAGLAYYEIPVAGAADVNLGNATALRRLIDQAPGPVLVHCASGNRVGALLALSDMQTGKVSADQAVAFGRSAGLGSLEPRVREVIEGAPAPACATGARC
ncbi:MAG: sulfur transferase domain-containing protein [Lysobacter sp.]